MRTVGLIVEYNPLHNGHYYHYQQSKKVSGADSAICVMSGHFLQRGEPAIVDKWARAEMALRMGADLVLELPVAFSAQPAEWFAYGAVSALDATGVVDSLCFGCESGRIDWLKAAADKLHEEPEELTRLLQLELKTGIPYPAAYSRAVAHLLPEANEEELAKPNNTLGLHYLIALRRLQSSIEPLTITRTKADYHQPDITDKQIASATAIRRILMTDRSLEGIRPFVPAATLDIMTREWKAGRGPIDWERLARPLLLQLMHHSPQQLTSFHEVNEGLEHRIRKALADIRPEDSQGALVEALIGRLKTKRYTRTKLQRTLLRILLNHTKQDLSSDTLRQGVPYLRVLGFSPRGQELLKRMKKTAKVPIVTKVTTVTSPLLELDLRATSVYSLGYALPTPDDWFRDYYEAPIRT
ncbi:MULTISPECIES: nucleotidyltransferase [unclassified Paenibacillus]|uniref:nucleotidyltransferase n=1 Tax=unclassified Paenibacillus TaxID=185978 RepID=UPI001AE326B6|nr:MULTISPECIES: nucleotidyltransferase [unclassified Paenibacillus]MBP1156055.1 putative nucleotidyltransferase [Paenibacillus sp. PvP091]MBP1168559.1 putative nucleotidyltransferase [Paenibacillus sp. PvR098]MBP2439587.1 putative nucleotidyltransferase [Paenibacillus sp. PvP052]